MNDKHLIVSIDHTDYDRFIREHDLPPGECFQCESVAEANRTEARNAEWGIACRVWHTPEWRQREGKTQPRKKGRAA